MPRPPARRPIAALALLMLSGSTAGAAAIPSYTVTDLGVTTAQVSVPTGDDATIPASDGRVYAFPRSIGDLVAPPEAYRSLKVSPSGDPDYYAFRLLDDTRVVPPTIMGARPQGLGLLSSDGVYVGTVLSGIEGHYKSASSVVSAARLQSDGTFSPLYGLWGADHNRENSDTGVIATAIDINKNDKVLGYWDEQGVAKYKVSLTFDMKTGILSELPSNLNGWLLRGPEWSPGGPLALDDQGRLLYFGVKREGDESTDPGHTLLLTPAGLASDPIATPEPSTLATLAAAIAGLAYRRHRKQLSSI